MTSGKERNQVVREGSPEKWHLNKDLRGERVSPGAPGEECSGRGGILPGGNSKEQQGDQCGWRGRGGGGGGRWWQRVSVCR